MSQINQDSTEQTEKRVWAEIHYDNLERNVRMLEDLLPEGCSFMAVVKANAYGHGAVPVSSYLNKLGVHSFAVATLQEGIELRRHNIQGDILILGYTSPKKADLIHQYDLIQTAADCAHALALDQAALNPIKIHIKLDTGMHRLGERPEHIEELTKLFSCPNLQISGMFSHLCVADSSDPDDIRFTKLQISTFFETVKELQSRGYNPGKLHLQNSYGALNYTGLPLSYARFGIAMYGAFSQPEPVLSKKYTLFPVLSLHARIAQIKNLLPGENVSYGRNFEAKHPMCIAAVTIGYADGLPRNLSNQEVPVLIHGKKSHILGNICMDQILVDVTDIPEAQVGDVVTLIGQDGEEILWVEDMAEKAGTITNEILCRLNLRED